MVISLCNDLIPAAANGAPLYHLVEVSEVPSLVQIPLTYLPTQHPVTIYEYHSEVMLTEKIVESDGGCKWGLDGVDGDDEGCDDNGAGSEFG